MNEYPFPTPAPEPVFPTGKRELRFCGAILVLSILLADAICFRGLKAQFALVSAGCLIASAAYLLRCGCTMDGYTGALLGLSLVLCGSFVRSDDGFVKFVTLKARALAVMSAGDKLFNAFDGQHIIFKFNHLITF